VVTFTKLLHLVIGCIIKPSICLHVLKQCLYFVILKHTYKSVILLFSIEVKFNCHTCIKLEQIHINLFTKRAWLQQPTWWY